MNSDHVPSTWKRLFAHGIDQVLKMILYFPFAKSFFLRVFTDEEVSISLLQLLVMLLIPVVYEAVFLFLYQATPGKWLLGLRVVPAWNSEEKLHWQQAVLRSFAERLTLFFSWAPYALAFFRYDRTHLFDWLAETRVVQSSPRISLPQIRWFLGLLLVVVYLYEGLITAGHLVNSIDWSSGQVDLRRLIDDDNFENIFEESE